MDAACKIILGKFTEMPLLTKCDTDLRQGLCTGEGGQVEGSKRKLKKWKWLPAKNKQKDGSANPGNANNCILLTAWETSEVDSFPGLLIRGILVNILVSELGVAKWRTQLSSPRCWTCRTVVKLYTGVACSCSWGLSHWHSRMPGRRRCWLFLKRPGRHDSC